MTYELSRDEALKALKQLEGQDLRQLAQSYNITVFKESGGFNKGWVGLLIERYLGLAANSRQEADFGSWELKVVPLKKLKKNGLLVPKETMAITMLDPLNVAVTPFEKSHLYIKLRKMIVCGRLFVDKQETSTQLIQFEVFDFDDQQDREMIEQIKTDYETVRQVLTAANTPTEGFLTLTGKMGVYVQPRTKGAGHGSTSRAFYMRTSGLKKLLKL